MPRSLLPLICTTALLAACQPAGSPAPLAEAATRELGFGTVADARSALSARGLGHHVRGSYEVFVDDPAHAVWLFTLPGSAAFPALVRRQLVQTEAGVQMRSAVFCEAPGPVCALLQENARLMDEAIVGTLDGPARPTPTEPPVRPGIRL